MYIEAINYEADEDGNMRPLPDVTCMVRAIESTPTEDIALLANQVAMNQSSIATSVLAEQTFDEVDLQSYLSEDVPCEELQVHDVVEKAEEIVNSKIEVSLTPCSKHGQEPLPEHHEVIDLDEEDYNDIEEIDGCGQKISGAASIAEGILGSAQNDHKVTDTISVRDTVVMSCLFKAE